MINERRGPRDSLRIAGARSLTGGSAVSTRRILAETEHLFAEVFREVVDGIVIASLEDQTILEVNEAYCRIVGYIREENVGHTPPELGIVTQFDLDDMRARVIKDREFAERELEITTKSGERRTVAVTARLVTLGGAERALVNVRDVSDRVVRERLLGVREAEQKALAELGLRALTHASPAELIDQAVRAVGSALGVEIVAVDELLADGNLRVRAAVGLGDLPIGVVKGSAGKGSQAGYTLLSAAAVISADLTAERRFTPAAVLVAHGARGSASVVIGTPERPWGVLIAASTRPRSFTADDSVFLEGIAHVLGIAWQREAAEHQLRRLGAAVEQSDDAILVIELDARIASWNQGAERLYGYRADEAIGREVAMLVPAERRGEEHELLARAARGELVRVETTRVRKDGERVEVATTLSPIRDPGGAVSAALGITRDITALKRAERELRRLADAVELGTDAVVSIDLQARVRHWNPSAERLFGYTADEALGRSLYELTVFTDEPQSQIERMLADEPSYQYETRRRRKDGTVIDVLLTISPWTVDGRVVGVTGITIDLTERKQAERERERLAAAAEFASDAIISTDRDGVVRHWNAGAARLYGYSPEEAVGRPLRELTVIAEEVTASITKVLAGERLQYETTSTRKDGTVIDVLTTLTPWTVAGEIVGITGVSIDLTERKKLENNLQYLADHDPLTTLYSRRRFTDELERHLRLAARAKHPPALVLFDVDHLKTANDTHGHAAGDALLKAFADVLRARARATDIVARLGGDEFAVILPEASESDALTVARDIRELLRASSGAPSVTASAGIVTLAGHTEMTADEMLICGDSALYEAKEHGGDQARVYSGQADGALTWVKRIHAAITQDRLVLHSQPIIDLRTGQVTHHELLVRMLGERGELIAPDRFIPTAERFGLIGEIDRWVTDAGLRLATAGTPVAINLSGHSIGDEAITTATHAAVTRGLKPGTVIFEITETAALGNLAAARAFAATLANDGCAVALDDFGTGFGSFTYLKHIPARYLKIDVDFIRELTTSATDKEVVKAIVGIASSLGKQTIAEGVENPETLALLREYGVDYAQGFHIAKPQPLDNR
ncbi:MAG: PAS domain S-box protein [Solirubrobacteraceae bacterium]